MTKIMSSVLLILFFTLSLFGQNDSHAKLHEQIVKEDNGKYIMEDFTLVKNKKASGAKSLQFKFYAEAPIEVIGRDNLVSLYSTYNVFMLMTMMQGAGVTITDLEIEDLDEMIGAADVEITYYIAKSGLQIQIKTDQGTNRITETWEKVFKK